MNDLDVVRSDLTAETEVLDVIVARLNAEQWALPTPSPRWSVADQIGHLTYFDGAAALAITDPAEFSASVQALFTSAMEAGDGGESYTIGAFRDLAHEEQLAAWRDARNLLGTAAALLSQETRVAWYGPSMSAKSFVTARLMEVWAHGQDIVDAVGATREPTGRLRHIAQLGYITRGWSYTVRGEQAPPGTVRLALTSPTLETWTWGPEEADDTVEGPAEDFCLVVTQRRHVDDTALSTGDLGRHWLVRAQAFAGGPTDPPAPRRK